MDDETLTTLLGAAMLKSPCATAHCRVSAEVHPPFYFDICHLDDQAHTCAVCQWGDGYPKRFVSARTLFETPREGLVAVIARWLDHLHADQALAESGGGDGAPLDAGSGTNAPFDSDGSASGTRGARGGDRVASRPGD